MLKRLAAFMVLLTMVFAFQSNVWAAAVHAQDTATPVAEEVFRLSENPQLALLTEQMPLAAATGFNGMKIESWFWVLSIPVAGLGQFLMGDMMKGLLFFFAPILLSVAAGILVPILMGASLTTGNPGAVAGAAGLAGTIGLIVWAGVLGIWIWNVLDAYFMNQSKMGMASLEEQEKMAAELERKLTALARFAQENQLVAYQDGLGLNHRLAAF
jgi:hypothetical protein